MDLRQLRYFVGIVQAGSLSRAADQLHVAQSAISHHLASLEAELDRQLVTRGPKGITLTEAGLVLYRHAEAILRHVEFAKQQAASPLNGPSGRVSLGLPVAWGGILGLDVFTRLRQTYPQIVLHLTDGNSALLRERLINGRLDIAVLFASEPARGLIIEPLLNEELFYVTADPDPSPISLDDVAKLPLLVPGPGSGSQRTADDVFSKRGLKVPSIAEIDSMTTLLRAIKAGVGNAILPWCVLYDGERDYPLNHRRFADATMMRSVALCFSEVGLRSPTVEAVAHAVRTTVYELMESGTWYGVSPIEHRSEPAAEAATAAVAAPAIAP